MLVTRVYPRECGETTRPAPQVIHRLGLSPRVRGNQHAAPPGDQPAGSIPASAGKPPPDWDDDRVTGVYPRECGETSPAYSPSVCFRGLSPRVRGNPKRWRPAGSRYWSIPASAGKPVQPVEALLVSRVYPRECGETSIIARQMANEEGLSPRVRGNRMDNMPNPDEGGSIPASVGKPRLPSVFRLVKRVYPRECGETSRSIRPMLDTRGLSPRVRGNLAGAAIQQADGGSIPASAGKPMPWSISRPAMKVYPRECGETVLGSMIRSASPGLSPRVRGNQPHFLLDIAHRGSIPASAGKPLVEIRRTSPFGVYPRECGETTTAAKRRWYIQGLSPRVRGNLVTPIRESGT